MSKMKRIFPILFVAGTLFLAPGCASHGHEHTTIRWRSPRSDTVGSVLNGISSVIMYPFHLVGDLSRKDGWPRDRSPACRSESDCSSSIAKT